MSSLIAQITRASQRVQFIQPGTGVVIVLDCCVHETHSRESPPTEYEIEDGQTVSDHIIVKPFQLELQGIISDTPIGTLSTALNTLTAVAAPPLAVVGIAGAQALYSAISPTASPSQVAFKQLLDLQKNKQPFDVLTTLRRYENMWIKSISVPRDAQTGKVLVFTVQLTELLLVSPQTVNLQIFKDADLAASFANQGKQEMEDLGLQRDFKAARSLVRVLGGVDP